ncbi:unnamed protein product [Rhizoctonia solani]|uniref:BTB domain-containing protein n=1 Tax=Rhizoctonia solani TaxID=456999 RepID=A0A8H2Y3I9_9AGAM|nr:unnamed protein product [Rhizoctonia solani]
MAKESPTTRTSRDYSALFTDKASDVKTDDSPNEIPNAKASEAPKRHPEFFFDNTLIAIQVEDTLFNVHKYQLAKSEAFSDRFKRPKEGDKPEEGSSPEHPIVLRGVLDSDFTALLRVLYASHFSSNQPAPEAPLIIPAFRLAYMFNFSDLCAFLLPLAEKNLDDIDKIVFAREFGIKEWLSPAHVRLCQREDPISGEEGRRLGVESVLIISRMREQYRSQPSGLSFKLSHNYCGPCAGLDCHYAGGYLCQECNTTGHASVVRFNRRSNAAQAGASTTNAAAIEAEVNKWVEDGCIMKDQLQGISVFE